MPCLIVVRETSSTSYDTNDHDVNGGVVETRSKWIMRGMDGRLQFESALNNNRLVRRAITLPSS